MFTGYVTSSALQAALEGYATQADLLVQANALSQLTSTVEGNTALVNGLVANPYTDEAALAAVASSGYAKSAELPTIAALSGGNLSLIESVPNASTTESDAPQVNVAGTTSIELSLDSPRSYIELEAVYRVDATVAYMDYSSFPLPELRPDSVSVSGSAALEVWLATLENGGLVCNQGEPSDLLFTNKLEQVTGPLDTHGVVQTGINPKNPSDSWGLKTRSVERTVVALPPQDGPSTLCIKVVALAYCLGEQLGAECSVETTVEDIIVKSF
jgi:hypothetical protein